MCPLSLNCAEEARQTTRSTILVDFWPGIQLYFPLVKYLPVLGIYEDLETAARRFQKHAHGARAQTIIFDLEDGCRKKEMSRALLRRELADLPKPNGLKVALRINAVYTEEYDKDLLLVRDLAAHIDVIMLAKAGMCRGAAEIRDLSAIVAGFEHPVTIQPIVEHPKSLKIASELMQYPTVHHVVFGIHDFSTAMGFQITPEGWIGELRFFLHQLLFEARIAGKGIIGGVETLIGQAVIPDTLVERHDVLRWLELEGDKESRVVYQHACEESAMGMTGKQVIHPNHIHLCKVAYAPSPSEVQRKIAILEAALGADALASGAIRYEGEMLDPPMFGKALQTLLRAHALNALSAEQIPIVLTLLQKLPVQLIRDNWPYGVICPQDH